jgi:hypothetical protein
MRCQTRFCFETLDVGRAGWSGPAAGRLPAVGVAGRQRNRRVYQSLILDLAVALGGLLQEPAEGIEPADQLLAPDLLLQVETSSRAGTF